MSTVTELITSLRHSLAAADETVMTTDQLRTAVLRAVAQVNRDFGVAYEVAGDVITPDLSAGDQELVLMNATIACCMIEIARAGRQPSFKAGTISIDRSKAVGAWRELLSSLRGTYERLAAMDNESRAMNLKSLLFERGVDVPPPSSEIYEP